MDNAGISNVDRPLGDAVASCSVPGASVDSVLVVKATALRINFNHLVAHSDCEDGDDTRMRSSKLLVMYRLRQRVTSRAPGRAEQARCIGVVSWVEESRGLLTNSSGTLGKARRPFMKDRTPGNRTRILYGQVKPGIGTGDQGEMQVGSKRKQVV